MRNAPLAAPFGGGAPHPCCPLWGKCREAAKGVSLVVLSSYHSTNRTPSVRPFGLPAPPLGSRGIMRIRLRFHKTVSACRNPSVSPYGLPAPLSGALLVRVSNLP